MKVVFLTDYFYPFVHGGAEISILELAKALVKKGQEVHILTPNYGAASEETIEGILIHRYPFITNLKTYSSQLTYFWHFNPLYWTILFIEIVKFVKKYHINIIHCQNAATIPPAIFVGKFLNKPVVVTFRDAQILCNYGNCLTKNQFGKTCSLTEYFASDFRHYYADKVINKSFVTFILQIIFALQGRFRVKTLKFFAKQCHLLIVSSSSQKRTFEANGFSKIEVINNIYTFPTTFSKAKKTQLLFAAKLSAGKGLDLLLSALPGVLKRFPKLHLDIVGGGDIVKYRKLSKHLKIDSRITFKGRLENSEVQKIRRTALLEIVPSLYPESFGRSALEAIANGVPVIASNRGGLTDIVEDNVTGFIIEPTEQNLAVAIINGIKHNKRLRRNIHKNYQKLRIKFEINPVEKHLDLYKSLL